MKVRDLTREIGGFQAALIAHRNLYERSYDVELDDYPFENENELQAQSRHLARMLGRLRPFLMRFKTNWLIRQPATGLTVDVLDVVVGMAHTVHIKGDAFQHAIDGIEQVIGSLQALGPEDEVPEDPKIPVRSSTSPDRRRLLSEMKSLLEKRTEVEEQSPSSDRGQEWLAKAASLLRQVDPRLVPQFSKWAQALQIGMSGYTAVPIWKQMLLMIRKAITDLELDVSTSVADMDPVTGLLSRVVFDTDVGPMVAEHQSREWPLALLVIDVDHFKSVNEHGHEVGDAVLRGVAGQIQAVVEGKGKVYRYGGGDEIVVILPNSALEEATPVAERVRRTVELARFEPLDSPVTISVGVAVFPEHGGEAQALFKAADQALLLAKQLGHNRVEVAR